MKLDGEWWKDSLRHDQITKEQFIEKYIVPAVRSNPAAVARFLYGPNVGFDEIMGIGSAMKEPRRGALQPPEAGA